MLITSALVLQDAQFAAKSMLSFQQLGSQNNWPVSHQYSACKETLQYLSDENTYLRQQLAARADTKFVKGILQCSVKNVQLVQIQPETDQTQHCIELETERVHLKHEIYSLRATLNAHYPGAMTVQFLENQLASETRLREYQAIQHDTVHKKLDEQSQDMKQLGEAVAGLAKQNHSLLSAINTKSSAPQLVRVLNDMFAKPAANTHLCTNMPTFAGYNAIFMWKCLAQVNTCLCPSDQSCLEL